MLKWNCSGTWSACFCVGVVRILVNGPAMTHTMAYTMLEVFSDFPQWHSCKWINLMAPSCLVHTSWELCQLEVQISLKNPSVHLSEISKEFLLSGIRILGHLEKESSCCVRCSCQILRASIAQDRDEWIQFWWRSFFSSIMDYCSIRPWAKDHWEWVNA